MIRPTNFFLFFSFYYIPYIVLSTLNELTYLIFIATLSDKYYCYLYLRWNCEIAKDTKAAFRLMNQQTTFTQQLECHEKRYCKDFDQLQV